MAKVYQVSWLYRDADNRLCTSTEDVACKSRKTVECWAREVARERDWRFLQARETVKFPSVDVPVLA